MYYCLTIAIISTLLWINQTFAEYINTINKQYSVDGDDKDLEIEKARIKTILSIIMGLFWSAVIYFW